MKKKRQRQPRSLKAWILLLGICLALAFLAWRGYQGIQIRSLQEKSQNYLVEYQADLVQALNRLGVSIPRQSVKFLPRYPAQYIDIQDITQQNIPLILQNDPQWAGVAYGTDGSQALWENGCAIVSLAMIAQYFDPGQLDPARLADWAGDRYYYHGQGTSWSIYEAFGQAFGYSVSDLGNDFPRAVDHLQAGHGIIVSVKPGYFTQGGHVMVLRGYQSGWVYLNDPNDDLTKLYSIQGLPESVLLESALNFWAFQPL